MDYSKLIRELRTKMIMTQTEFAEKLGVSFTTISRWESGKFTPTIKTKRRLQPYFKKYGIKVDEYDDEPKARKK